MLNQDTAYNLVFMNYTIFFTKYIFIKIYLEGFKSKFFKK